MLRVVFMDQAIALRTVFQVKTPNQLKQWTKVFSLGTKLNWWAVQVAATQVRIESKIVLTATRHAVLKSRLSKANMCYLKRFLWATFNTSLGQLPRSIRICKQQPLTISSDAMKSLSSQLQHRQTLPRSFPSLRKMLTKRREAQIAAKMNLPWNTVV